MVSFVKVGGGLEGCTWPSCIERDRGRQRLAVLRAGEGAEQTWSRVTSQIQRLDGVKESADQARAWKF